MTKDSVSLTIQPRELTGRAVKALRREGIVPLVIHDHGKDSVLGQADYVELSKVWRKAGKHTPVSLTGAAKAYTALIKDVELDPRKNQIKHIVFNAVDANQKVEAEVPVHAKYAEDNESSPAERGGLIVLTQADVVLVEAVPSKLPEVLYFDGEKLAEVGDSATVADLILPEGVSVKTDESQSLATVYEPSAVQAANDAAGGDEEVAPESEGGEETTTEAEAPVAE